VPVAAAFNSAISIKRPGREIRPRGTGVDFISSYKLQVRLLTAGKQVNQIYFEKIVIRWHLQK
jgi:hypothetical protein